jgi:FSR family fosmidomycin resistance protein-like MFS transporter
MASLSAGHFAVDLAQGAIPALLVFLADELELSYTLVGAVVLVATFSSSIVQPAFGHWSDRRGAMWLLPGGVALAGVCAALAAVAPTYPLLLLAVLGSGLGVAAYHPEGSKFAAYVSGRRRASGMAVFSVGGNAGFGVGPLLASAVVLAFGLEGGLLLAVPGLAVAALLVAERRYLAPFASAAASDRRFSGASDRPRAFLLLQGVVVLRSVAHYGLFAFIPLWEHDVRGSSEAHATRLLSLFLLAGALGTLVGGPLADRFGRRPVLVATHAAAAPLILVYVLVGGPLGYAALALAGAAVISTFGVTTVLSQEYLPRRIGMASGLSVGLAIGLGGIFALTLGGLADSVGLKTAMLVAAAGPAAAAVAALWLPRDRRRVLERTPRSTIPGAT